MQVARERKVKVAGVIQDTDTFAFGHDWRMEKTRLVRFVAHRP